MDRICLTINGKPVTVADGTTVLEAARQADIYVPTLCAHPDLPPAVSCVSSNRIFQEDFEIVNADPGKEGQKCGLCLVAVEGVPGLCDSCAVEAGEGMIVVTDNEQIRVRRKENLMMIMARHRHACLTCSQQEGCSRTQCSENMPEIERCCEQFGHCELQNVAGYIGIADNTPRWVPPHLPIFDSDPLFIRDYNLCIGCTRCVRACRDLRGIDALGFVFDADGQCRIGCVASGFKASGCRFCTACVAVCPTGALVDKGVEPATREEDLVPCRAACPVNMDVPGYLRRVAAGESGAADAIIRERVPFPGVLGRVCSHPCETVCRRGDVNESIAICALKRYAADSAAGRRRDESRSVAETGKQVAVAGSGPAGLTAAFYLRLKGHRVTLFEAESEAGGMMRYGIPRYRLPADVLEREIEDILGLGVDFRPGMQLGVDMTLDTLQQDGFDAVFLATGAQKSRRMKLDGCDPDDVMWGIDFLKTATRGKQVALKGHVLVIGGGNVAVDAAMTAFRCGAATVSMACLEAEHEMPANPRVLESALAEGVMLLPSCGPTRVLRKNGRVTGVDLVQCTCVLNEHGDFCPIFDGEGETVHVDHLIVAVGQETDLSAVTDGYPGMTRDGLIVIDGKTMETDMPGLFAGGDVTSRTGTVVDAIAAGRKAASAIDVALGGDGDIDETQYRRPRPDPVFGTGSDFAMRVREVVPERKPARRRNDFDEIRLGYSDAQARREAARCLQCDLRLSIGCNQAPSEQLTAFDMTRIRNVPETAGVYRLFDAEKSVLAIQGTSNLKQALMGEMSENRAPCWFDIKVEQMYTQRESQLLQKHLQQHGYMPGEGDDDDLF